MILCTGNSCRSIIAEALINNFVDGVKAYSSGVNPSGKVNPNAKKVLQEFEIWEDKYHSKILDEILYIEFDLVISVCDNAQKNCPIFPKKTKVLHIPFKDPDGLEYNEFQICYKEIKNKLLPIIKQIFPTSNLKLEKS